MSTCTQTCKYGGLKNLESTALSHVDWETSPHINPGLPSSPFNPTFCQNAAWTPLPILIFLNGWLGPPSLCRFKYVLPERIANVIIYLQNNITSDKSTPGTGTIHSRPQAPGSVFPAEFRDPLPLTLSLFFLFPLFFPPFCTLRLLPAWFESENVLHGAVAGTSDRRDEEFDKIHCRLCMYLYCMYVRTYRLHTYIHMYIH